MKNIHVITTDKPSKLFKANQKLVFDNTNDPTKCISAQHIYITNDEEIKEGDWVVAKEGIWKDTITKITRTPITDVWKKIILTTDQDLDGVQVIDDEFLEWFIKNPSCEEVEVFKERYHGVEFIDDYPKGFFDYKIIIPQEEPKQTVEEYEQQGLEKYSYELKQETLEEARKYAELSYYGDEVDVFVNGVKWQAERMYSENDMTEFAVWNIIQFELGTTKNKTNEELLKEFEQSKKK